MNSSSNANEKARIRDKYRDSSSEGIEVIPAIGEIDFYSDVSSKRVAVYARVSTDDSRQTSSFELQQSHYEDIVRRHPGWELVEIYADEGISGTSLKNRDAFMRMINDCEAGLVDLIVTKSVSRFARNVYDCIGYVRRLAALKSPVGVFFETENLYTLNNNSEMSLSFIATLAQEESHAKSNSMNLSYEMRFRRGLFHTPALLGYDQDENGQLKINEDEAATVRLAFFMFLYGYELSRIAETLNQLGRTTKRGNQTWSAATVQGILTNERHCGDVLARKTWTPNYLDHKSKKNAGNRNQYRMTDHHEPIISRNDFVTVQHMIANARSGFRGILPSLHVIEEGALKGYVIVNLTWAGFQTQDYLDASRSVLPDTEQKPSDIYYSLPNQGDFDLRDYELVHKQFFGSQLDESITFSKRSMYFSTSCVNSFKKVTHIELLIHPDQRTLVIRPSSKEKKSALRWVKAQGDQYLPKAISNKVFMPILFDLMAWNDQYKYRVKSIKRKNPSGEILIFDLREPEIIIPNESRHEMNDPQARSTSKIKPLTSISSRSFVAYPATWAEGFGSSLYVDHQPPELLNLPRDVTSDTQNEGKPFEREGEEAIEPTSDEVLHEQINNLINSMKQEVNKDVE